MLALRCEFGWRFSRLQFHWGLVSGGSVDAAAPQPTVGATIAQAAMRAMAAMLAAVHPRQRGCAVIIDSASHVLSAAYEVQNEFAGPTT